MDRLSRGTSLVSFYRRLLDLEFKDNKDERLLLVTEIVADLLAYAKEHNMSIDDLLSATNFVWQMEHGTMTITKEDKK